MKGRAISWRVSHEMALLELNRDGLAGLSGFVDGVDYLHQAQGLFGGVQRSGFALDGFDEVGSGTNAAHVFAGRGDDAAVDAVAVFLDVEFAGIDGGVIEAIDAEESLDFATGFGALEDHGDFLALDHFGPGDLQAEDLASLESDETMSGVFHIGRAADAVGDAPRAFELFVLDEFGEGLAEDMSGFGVTHEVHGEVNHVQEVDERAATGESLGGEPTTEAWDAGAADPFGLSGIDGADGALFDVGHHRLGLGSGAIVEVEEHFLACLFGCHDDFLHFFGVQRRGFLGEDVFACFEALDGQRFVKLVRNDDADGLDLRAAFEHGLDGLIRLGDAVFLSGFGGSARGCVSDGNDFCASLTESCCVILQHAAGSDNSYFD